MPRLIRLKSLTVPTRNGAIPFLKNLCRPKQKVRTYRARLSTDRALYGKQRTVVRKKNVDKRERQKPTRR